MFIWVESAAIAENLVNYGKLIYLYLGIVFADECFKWRQMFDDGVESSVCVEDSRVVVEVVGNSARLTVAANDEDVFVLAIYA